MKSPEDYHGELEPLLDELRLDPIGIEWQPIDKIISKIQQEAFRKGQESVFEDSWTPLTP